jgi:dihydroorotate dehydrogenase
MGLAAGLGGTSRAANPPELRQRLWGLDFPNPIGIAAGFDKDARAPEALRRLGFGFVEIGTVTPRPQAGNPKPRVFRLEEDAALINRMGFNSGGLDRVIERMSARHREAGIVGVNIGKNRDSADAAPDYAEGVRRAAPFADYLVVNVSSPNTPGLRDLQARVVLEVLLREVLAARDEAGARPPLLVKIAPDLTPDECADIAAVALAAGIDGMIIANTTVARPLELRSSHANEAGGLSGRPLFGPSTALLADMYRLTAGRLPLIGVGGVASAEDAYVKIRAGASLVQLYTALVFAGPALLGRIKTGLAALLRRDGFASLAEAIGADLVGSPRSEAPVRAP